VLSNVVIFSKRLSPEQPMGYMNSSILASRIPLLEHVVQNSILELIQGTVLEGQQAYRTGDWRTA